MEIERILVGVDWSDWSLHAVDVARRLAQVLHASVTLVHGCVPGGRAPSSGMKAKPARGLEEEARARLVELAGMRLAGTEQGPHVAARRSSPSGIVCATAAQTRADLVIVAHRGLTGLKSVLLGSVAQRVVRRAPCSVLVVRTVRELDRFPGRMLICTDFSTGSAAAIAAGAAIGRAFGPRVGLVHVFGGSPDRERAEPAYRDKLERTAASLASEGYDGPVEAMARGHESVPEAIVKLARRSHMDLVVLGTSRRSPFHLGSVARAVVTDAPCAVLVARDRASSPR